MMKRTMILTAALFALAAAAAFAQPAPISHTLTLTGVVPPIFEFTVTPTGDASNLDIQSGETGTAIATIAYRTNNRAGYTITVETAHPVDGQPVLRGTESADASVPDPDTVPYTLSFPNDEGTIEDLTFASGVATLVNSSKKTNGSVSRSLDITFPGKWVNADTYADTLTFTMTAK